MTKRAVDIDDDLLDRARASAGTQTVKATVEARLQALVELHIGVQHVRRLRGHRSLDADALDEARVVRMPQVP